MSTIQKLHHGQPLLFGGAPLNEARSAMILLHGRGGDAEDIMRLGEMLVGETVALVALQAANNTWYPFRFMDPIAYNEPWLSSALQFVHDAVHETARAGIRAEQLVLLGFSQGSCLALEYAARNTQRFGGVVGLAGGLIGPEGTPRDYEGSFYGTPVFMGCGDQDPHIPFDRVQETGEILKGLGAEVDVRIYPGLGHVIIDDEVQAVRKLVAAL